MLYRRAILKDLLSRALRSHAQDNNLPLASLLPRSRLTRRGFLGGVAALGAVHASGLFGTAWAAATGGKAQPSIAIIGAGIAGLTAGYYLKKAGITAHIFEASTRTGGRMLSRKGPLGGDLVVDLGAELVNSDHEDMIQLAKDLNIPLFDRHKAADAFAAPATRYFGHDGLTAEKEIAAAMAPIAAQIASDAKSIEEDYDEHAPALDSMSVKDYLDKHQALIGSGLVRKILDNSIRSEYGCEPEEASALLLIYNLPAVDGEDVEVLSNSDEIFAVTGGSQAITDALTQFLKEQITLNTPLKGITRGKDGFALDLGGPAPAVFDHVILAVPFTALKKFAWGNLVPETMAQYIAESRLGKNEKALVGYTESFWRSDLFSHGLMTGHGPCAQIWDPCLRQNDRPGGVLNFYLGGRQVQDMRQKSADEAADILSRALRAADPRFTDGRNGKALKTNWSGNPYTQGAYSTFPPGMLTRYADFFWIEGEGMDPEQSVAFDGLYFCGEQLSDAFFGFMNGGAQTGRLAAQSILATVSKMP